MEKTMNEYKSSAASLFAAAAREPLTIWAFCPVCCIRTEQIFEREDERREYYICSSCGQRHSFAVR